jgi:hypothetical protein
MIKDQAHEDLNISVIITMKNGRKFRGTLLSVDELGNYFVNHSGHNYQLYAHECTIKTRFRDVVEVRNEYGDLHDRRIKRTAVLGVNGWNTEKVAWVYKSFDADQYLNLDLSGLPKVGQVYGGA